jgi:hypothetical protein
MFVTKTTKYVLGGTSAVALPTAADATTTTAALNADNIDQLHVDLVWDPVAISDILYLIIEFANPLNGEPVTADWGQECGVTYASGVSTVAQNTYSFTATGVAAVVLPIDIPITSRWYRIKVQETAAGVHGTIRVKVTQREQS